MTHPDDRVRQRLAIEAAQREDRSSCEMEERLVRKDGTAVWVRVIMSQLPREGPHPAVLMVQVVDIGEFKSRERDLTQQALHDPLTGLANRRLLRDRIDQAIAHRKRHGGELAVLMLDLDGFKELNDRLGHAAGDDVLIAVAERLVAAVREEDTVARVGGDEFAIVCPGLPSVEGAEMIPVRLREALSLPMHLVGEMVYMGASMGMAIALAADAAEPLLRRADSAMYDDKRRPPVIKAS
jgi:diguanylate cyclase (GGDEF)-like protein